MPALPGPVRHGAEPAVTVSASTTVVPTVPVLWLASSALPLLGQWAGWQGAEAAVGKQVSILWLRTSALLHAGLQGQLEFLTWLSFLSSPNFSYVNTFSINLFLYLRIPVLVPQMLQKAL